MVHVSYTHQHGPTLAELERSDGRGRAGDVATEPPEWHSQERRDDDAHGGLVAHEHHAALGVLATRAKNHGERSRGDGERRLAAGGRDERGIGTPCIVGLRIALLDFGLEATLPRSVGDLAQTVVNDRLEAAR
jgi:hypothetical protein